VALARVAHRSDLTRTAFIRRRGNGVPLIEFPKDLVDDAHELASLVQRAAETG
jgi:hypothetical protein